VSLETLMRLHQANGRSTAHSFPMDIRFPGGLRVDALHEGFWIRTDQPVAQGGSGAAPSPFDLFLASVGTCAGFYALRFCQQRNLDTEGLALSVTPEQADDGKRVARIRIEIALPPEFPQKYREAILRAVDQCSVKRHLAEPPQFDVFAVAAPESEVAPAEMTRDDWLSFPPQ
jgi:putative redox protein